VIGSQDAPTLSGFVRCVISDKVELLASDENIAYELMKDLPHEVAASTTTEALVALVIALVPTY
jgi:hypothetical protein